jgi:hypothetical protein
LRLDTSQLSPEQASEAVIEHLRTAGIIDREWVFIP